ncbi:hypothetical protein HYW75_05035 [Candidatus Pacearchaeota archaeon]|nr:hypothetical protein [Candidatus Pacearchaeota archaeon]
MKKKIFLFFILTFLLNLFWEVWHSLLYNWNKLPLQNDVYFYILRILYSTLGDLILLGIIFLLLSIKNMNIKWLNKPSKLDYILIIFSGLVLSIFIEFRALTEGRWFYNDLMPTILGVGITPLLQLFTTFIFALWLIEE